MAKDPLEAVRIRKRVEEAQKHQFAGDFPAAEAIFGELLAEHAGDAMVMRGFGILCVQQQRLVDAEHWLKAAVELDPEQARSWNDYGEALRLLGRLEEAGNAYLRALELEPALVEAMNNLAVVLAGCNDLEGAKRWLMQAIESVPEDPYPYNNLGVVLEAEGRLDEALQNYERAVQRNSDFTEAKENYASLLARCPDQLLSSMNRLLEEAKRLE